MNVIGKQKSFFFQICPKTLSSILFLARMNSTSTVERLSLNLSFRKNKISELEDNERPLVIIYGWLVAKSKHIFKYGDFYLDKGFDVLHVKVNPSELLWPRKVHTTINGIHEFINSSAIIKQPLLIHGFSVGAYLYGETINKLKQDEKSFEIIKQRLRGQIFDSAVDIEGVPRGTGMAVTNNPILQKSIKYILDTYLKIFDKQVTQNYRRSSMCFHENYFQTPSMMLYSKNDVIGIPSSIEAVIKSWENNNTPIIISKCWEDSPHVSHFMSHQMEYISYLNQFLQLIKLGQSNIRKIEKMSI